MFVIIIYKNSRKQTFQLFVRVLPFCATAENIRKFQTLNLFISAISVQADCAPER